MMQAISWMGRQAYGAGEELMTFCRDNPYGFQAYEGAKAFTGGLWHATPFGDDDMWERAVARNKLCAYAGCAVSLAVQFALFQHFFVPYVTIVIPYGAEVVVSGASIAKQILWPAFALYSVSRLRRGSEVVQETAEDTVARERLDAQARFAAAARAAQNVAVGVVGAWVGRRLIGGWTGTAIGFVVGNRIANSVGNWLQGDRAAVVPVDPNAAPLVGFGNIASPDVQWRLGCRFRQIREDLTSGNVLRAANAQSRLNDICAEGGILNRYTRVVRGLTQENEDARTESARTVRIAALGYLYNAYTRDGVAANTREAARLYINELLGGLGVPVGELIPAPAVVVAAPPPPAAVAEMPPMPVGAPPRPVVAAAPQGGLTLGQVAVIAVAGPLVLAGTGIAAGYNALRNWWHPDAE